MRRPGPKGSAVAFLYTLHILPPDVCHFGAFCHAEASSVKGPSTPMRCTMRRTFIVVKCTTRRTSNPVKCTMRTTSGASGRRGAVAVWHCGMAFVPVCRGLSGCFPMRACMRFPSVGEVQGPSWLPLPQFAVFCMHLMRQYGTIAGDSVNALCRAGPVFAPDASAAIRRGLLWRACGPCAIRGVGSCAAQPGLLRRRAHSSGAKEAS